MKYYIVEPEVAGGFGKKTQTTVGPNNLMLVLRLNYEFDGWLGDELLESTPCFIVTKSLGSQLERVGLTGFSLDEVDITKSQQFVDVHGNCELPEFNWFKIVGRPGQDDFGLTSALELVVSERALDSIQGKITHAASIVEYCAK